MRKLFVSCMAVLMLLCVGAMADAKVMKLAMDADPVSLDPHVQLSGGMLQYSHAMDADPVSLDPHVQLSGGMLQYSHIVFDPLVRWTKQMTFEPRLATKWERIDEQECQISQRQSLHCRGCEMDNGTPQEEPGFQGAF